MIATGNWKLHGRECAHTSVRVWEYVWLQTCADVLTHVCVPSLWQCLCVWVCGVRLTASSLCLRIWIALRDLRRTCSNNHRQRECHCTQTRTDTHRHTHTHTKKKHIHKNIRMYIQSTHKNKRNKDDNQKVKTKGKGSVRKKHHKSHLWGEWGKS